MGKCRTTLYVRRCRCELFVNEFLCELFVLALHTMWSRYRIMQNLKFSCFLFSLNIYIYFYILFARLCMANKPFRYTYIQLQNRIWKKQQINSTRLKHRKPNKIHKNVHIMLEIRKASRCGRICRCDVPKELGMSEVCYGEKYLRKIAKLVLLTIHQY